MPTFTDTEFGQVVIRRSARSRSIRMRVAPNGRLSVSAPLYTPQLFIKRALNASRPQLRELLAKHRESSLSFEHGMRIGKSHAIVVQEAQTTRATRRGQQIIVSLAAGETIDAPAVTSTIRPVVIDALRLEAKSYLPKRLAYLAERHGFNYQRVRFSHAGSRWGSCSSTGTISLNIALMKLPFELIDYVLIHELTHTKYLNHSRDFWGLVEQADPNYKEHRRSLKSESPAI